ncbi:MAG: hypothetical protein I3273_04070 [Candidatus Moeniiplasma glomeromycotorum]|nr:hypothetical protein [Candidatus Moeniiplasma glomeromycotorum]
MKITDTELLDELHKRIAGGRIKLNFEYLCDTERFEVHLKSPEMVVNLWTRDFNVEYLSQQRAIYQNWTLPLKEKRQIREINRDFEELQKNIKN